MLFNSYTFLVFFAAVLLLYNLPITWKTKKIILLVSSFVFYAAWNPPFILLLWLSTIVDFEVGKRLYHQQNPVKKKLLLVVSLAGNLGMLFFFKYGGFLLENFVGLVSAFGIDYHPAKPDIILPAGISFYTFTTLSYTIDMYKRESPPVKNLLDFSLFVTFFPHLVAGPIVRPPQLVPQFETPRNATKPQFVQGLFLLTLGLFMKVFLADNMLASISDSVFNARMPLQMLDSWSGVLAFSGQIFFDFAGYSTCAIGIAATLGFVLPENFRYPYAAVGFSDFWRRWHITLSAWLRDYLYIPLGGNRKSSARTYINLMITMLLGGLWHGASWTFVVWGALHGLFLCVERAIKSFTESKKKVASGELIIQSGLAPSLAKSKVFGQFLIAMFTFFLVNVTWVFFRSPDFGSAGKMLASLFGFMPPGVGMPLLTTLDLLKVGIITFGLLACHWLMRNTTILAVAEKTPWWVAGIVWSVMLVLLLLSQESSSAFIYFQF